MARVGYTAPRLSLWRHGPGICLLTIFLFTLPELRAQEASGRRRVEILHSDSMKYERLEGGGRNRLNGNVRLKHNDLFMECDSALYYDETNQVLAYSRIHIRQGDSIHIRGDHLIYNGDTRKAQLTGNVRLSDNEMQLFTDKVDYDVNTQVARYDNGGRILSGDNTLTSIVGVYFTEQKMLHFRDSVRIVNPEYVMTADTMRYDTGREIAWFDGPTEAVGDSIYLYCEAGWSDTRNDISQLMHNAILDNRKQHITGDTLWYDARSEQGEAFGHVVITDTTDNIAVGGDYAWYAKRPERFLLTGTPWFSHFADNDTMTLRADTLRSVPVEDSSGVFHRLLKAYYGCTMFSAEMQGRCDSLSYSFQDSVIRLYDDPILWSRENQMTADSITIYTVNSKADHMDMHNHTFVVSEVDVERYDQISGKNLSGFFEDNQLRTIKVTGNCEAIYYVVDDDKLVGVNRSRSATIDIYIEEGKIAVIDQQNPEGTLYPPLHMADTEMRLDGFRWHPALRPDRISMGIGKIFPVRNSAGQEEVSDEGKEIVAEKSAVEEKEAATEQGGAGKRSAAPSPEQGTAGNRREAAPKQGGAGGKRVLNEVKRES